MGGGGCSILYFCVTSCIHDQKHVIVCKTPRKKRKKIKNKNKDVVMFRERRETSPKYFFHSAHFHVREFFTN